MREQASDSRIGPIFCCAVPTSLIDALSDRPPPCCDGWFPAAKSPL
jgi:hypothetical protein